MARKSGPLAKFVIPPRGPVRERKSGAGPHDSRANRQRARGDIKRAHIEHETSEH